jgi:hypothetical protein
MDGDLTSRRITVWTALREKWIGLRKRKNRYPGRGVEFMLLEYDGGEWGSAERCIIVSVKPGVLEDGGRRKNRRIGSLPREGVSFLTMIGLAVDL